MTPAAEKKPPALPPPFSRDGFHEDVAQVFLFCVRNVAWITNVKTAWAITGTQPDPDIDLELDLCNPEASAADLGLTYERIASTTFAKVMERLYEYAYFGRVDVSYDQIEYESIFTWISYMVKDAVGDVAHEWDSYGADMIGASHCLMVVETANARRILEGHEPFAYIHTPVAKSGRARVTLEHEGSLTIRQMALLAGMEEMSIRAAANPKRPNALKTYNDHGTTLIALEVAKAWLTAKGRYVPITRYWSASDIDLTNRSFSHAADFCSALEARTDMLLAQKDRGRLLAEFQELGFDPTLMGFLEVEHRLTDPNFVRSLAAILDLPPELLILRAREAMARQELAHTERKLREVLQANRNTESTPRS